MGNVERAQALYEAFGQGDIPAVFAAFDPDIEWHEAEGNPYEPSGKAWIGLEPIQELFMKLGDTEWEGFTVTPRKFHDAGDTVIAEARYGGTYKATGKAIDAQVCHIWTFRGDRIVGFQQYVDTAQLQDVTGARAGLQAVAEATA